MFDGDGPPPVHAGTVYRGVSFKSETEKASFIASLQKGHTVDKGFLSTSKDAGVAVRFSREKSVKNSVLLVIKSKTGRDISSMSKFKKEKEVLMKPGVKLKFSSMGEVVYDGKKSVVVSLEEI
jgi:hypothetical protein